MAEDMKRLQDQAKQLKEATNYLLLGSHGGHMETVAAGLEAGARPDAQDAQGNSALHHAAMFGFLDICEFLVARGADAEADAKNGRTPLHLAAYYDQAHMVPFLVDKGAYVNAVDFQDDTPLSLACRQSSVQTVRALLGCKPDVTCKNKHGLTALGEAIIRQKLDVAQELLDSCEDCTLKSMVNGYSLLHLSVCLNLEKSSRFLLEREPALAVEHDTKDGATPLHCAAACLSKSSVDTLLLNGAEVSAEDALGRTALDVVELAEAELQKHDETLGDEDNAAARERLRATKRGLESAGARKGSGKRRAVSSLIAKKDTGSFSDRTRAVTRSTAEQEAERRRARKVKEEEAYRAAEAMKSEEQKKAEAWEAAVAGFHRDDLFQCDFKTKGVRSAVEEVKSNPQNMLKHQNNPVVMRVLNRLREYNQFAKRHGLEGAWAISLGDIAAPEDGQPVKFPWSRIKPSAEKEVVKPAPKIEEEEVIEEIVRDSSSGSMPEMGQKSKEDPQDKGEARPINWKKVLRDSLYRALFQSVLMIGIFYAMKSGWGPFADQQKKAVLPLASDLAEELDAGDADGGGFNAMEALSSLHPSVSSSADPDEETGEALAASTSRFEEL